MGNAAIIGGSLIEAGAGLAGGFLSRSGAKKAAKKAWKRQKEAMQNQIQWRVEDAKKAGLHPLFALGAQTPGPVAPVDFGSGGIGEGIADAGQAIGGAVSRLGGREERKEQALRLKLLESQINEADARTQAIQSETARQNQSAVSQVSGAEQQLGVMHEVPAGVGSHGVQKKGALINDPIFVYESDLGSTRNPAYAKVGDLPGSGIIDLQASPQISHKKGNRGLQAGEHPGWKEYVMPNGLPVIMPEADSFGEALEQLPLYMMPGVWSENVRRYGTEWADDMRAFLFSGLKPESAYLNDTLTDMKKLYKSWKDKYFK